MTYLVDANILCEPTKDRPDPKVVAWLTSNEGHLVVDAVILGEIALSMRVLARGASGNGSSVGSRKSPSELNAWRGTPQLLAAGLILRRISGRRAEPFHCSIA